MLHSLNVCEPRCYVGIPFHKPSRKCVLQLAVLLRSSLLFPKRFTLPDVETYLIYGDDHNDSNDYHSMSLTYYYFQLTGNYYLRQIEIASLTRRTTERPPVRIPKAPFNQESTFLVSQTFPLHSKPANKTGLVRCL